MEEEKGEEKGEQAGEDQRTNVRNISVEPEHGTGAGKVTVHFCVQSDILLPGGEELDARGVPLLLR